MTTFVRTKSLGLASQAVPLVGHNGWEIGTSYPYTVRNRYYTPAVCIDGHGYPSVKLGERLYYMHALVAMQFIPNPENKKRVRHINGIRSDYHINNLVWY